MSSEEITFHPCGEATVNRQINDFGGDDRQSCSEPLRSRGENFGIREAHLENRLFLFLFNCSKAHHPHFTERFLLWMDDSS